MTQIRNTPSSIKAAVLQQRSKQLAVNVVKLTRSLKRKSDSRVLSNQLVRSATSVAANYRAVCRARSKKEFIAKLGVVIEEADETLFWLEMLVDVGDANPITISRLTQEANELVAIFVASKRTAEQSAIDIRQSSSDNRSQLPTK